MPQWSQISDWGPLKDGIKGVSSAVKDYAHGNPKGACIGVGVASTGVLFWFFGKDMRQRFFAWINNKFAAIKQEDYENFKRPVFSCLKELTSHDPKLREEKAIRILEIGAGIGANFIMYPDNTRLIVADPNPYFEKYFTDNRAKFPNVKCETVIVAKGEDIDMMASESVDAVVMTLVLCSVDDVSKIIKQIKRVLVPGGKYIFIEHIKEWDRSKHWLRLALQHILTWSRVWPFVFDGCMLNRDPRQTIQSAGFASVEMMTDYAPVSAWFAIPTSPHLKGVATK